MESVTYILDGASPTRISTGGGAHTHPVKFSYERTGSGIVPCRFMPSAS